MIFEIAKHTVASPGFLGWGRDAGGLGATVGFQRGPVTKPLVGGLGDKVPQKLKVFRL